MHATRSGKPIFLSLVRYIEISVTVLLVSGVCVSNAGHEVVDTRVDRMIFRNLGTDRA
jgi:hypothetical protein